MRKIAENRQGATVRLSETESKITVNSLSEVVHGIRIPESEFIGRIGGSRDEVANLLDGIKGPKSIARDGLTFRLDLSDLRLLRNVVREITEGSEIEAWEYPTRIGAPLQDGKRLLRDLEVLVN